MDIPISNRFVLPLAAAYYGLALTKGLAAGVVLANTAMAVAITVAFWVGFRGAIGGGAVKLIGVAVLWLGLGSGLTFIAIALLSAGIVGYAARGAKLFPDDRVPLLPFAALAFVATLLIDGLPAVLA